MNIIVAISYAVCGFYFLFKKRSFDLFSVAYFCLVIYTYPLIIGEILDPVTFLYVNINIGISLFYIFASIFILILALIFDRSNFFFDYRLARPNWSAKLTSQILLVFLFFLFAHTFLVADLSLFFDPDKTKLATGNTGSWSFIVLVSMAIVSIELSRNVYLSLGLVCSVSVIIFSLFVGSRADFAAMIILAFLLIYRGHPIRIASHFKLVFFGFLAIFVLYFYKVVYKSVKVFDFSGAAEKISNYQFLEGFFGLSEQSLILANFNNVVNSEPSYSLGYMLGALTRLVPIVGSRIRDLFGLEYERFASHLMDSYYSSLSYGLGSTFWGELYYAGGWLGVVIFALIWGGIIYYVNCLIMRGSGRGGVYILAPSFIYFTFYIHRLDTYILFSVFSSCLVIYLASKVAVFVLKRSGSVKKA